jgi:histidinol-phosphate/aromatic aminotransferase/cobyric acid decarboxylase-like protein
LNKIYDRDIHEMAEAHGLDPAKIIDFSVSINPLGLSPRAKKVILKDGPAAALRYPDPRCSGLRKALAGIHRTPEARARVDGVHSFAAPPAEAEKGSAGDPGRQRI